MSSPPTGSEKPPRGALDEYRAKRSTDRSPEPFGRLNPALSGVFVVQKHAASRLHYDLRLEMDGVLKSWAVPKGPSFDPTEKRLAIQTEDHPIEYQDYEGVIPDGNYGAGAMIVWDKGTWLPIEGDKVGLDQGKLLFELRGYKLRGVWTLFKTQRKTGGNEWLLVKKPDRWARDSDDADPPEHSIYSGLTVEELREGGHRSHQLSEKLEEIEAPRRKVDPEKQRVMLATIAEQPFSDKDWLFELKHDGYRLLAAKEGSGSRLFYRRGADATRIFPDIARAVAALPASSLVLDGEVVVLDQESRSSFQLLQKRTHLSRAMDIQRAAVRLPATLFAFDLLAFDHFDLRSLPLHQRKQLLRRLMPPSGPLRYCDHILERGEDFYQAVSGMGLEGIVAKKVDSTYRPERSSSWLKIRVDRRDDFVIVGMSPPRRGRTGFGALHLAAWSPEAGDGGELIYAGRVGTGFSEAQLGSLHDQISAHQRPSPPCTGPVPTSRGQVWTEPELVCEVRYKEWTEEGLLRQPAFLGLRPDKTPEECVAPERRGTHPPAEPAAALVVEEDTKTLHLTNLDKVFWPDEGYTKGDLIDFYRAAAPAILPFLSDRPLVLTRYPDGIEGKSFFQKNAPEFAPEWIRTEAIYSEHSERDIEYFVGEDVESLIFIANLGAIPLHIWSSRTATLQQPDWCILDLDPKEAPFTDVIEVALAVRALCDDIGLPCFAKTSGSTGIHVLLPLGRQCTYQQSRLLGELIARVVAHESPEIATTERVIGRRRGKVYLDYGQNGHGRLLVAPFSVRPLPGAPVSTPLRWSEVNSDLTIESHNIRSVPPRLRRMKKDPWKGILDITPDLGSALAALSQRSEA